MLDKQSGKWSQRQQRAKGKCPAGIRFPRVKCYLKSSWHSLSSHPVFDSPTLPTFPTSQLTWPSVVPPLLLFSGCSKCLETAVGAGTGPSGRPHQGTLGPEAQGWVREERCLSRDQIARQLSDVQILRHFRLANQELPFHPHKHTHLSVPLNIFLQLESNSRRMYFTYTLLSEVHILHDGYLHYVSIILDTRGFSPWASPVSASRQGDEPRK